MPNRSCGTWHLLGEDFYIRRSFDIVKKITCMTYIIRFIDGETICITRRTNGKWYEQGLRVNDREYITFDEKIDRILYIEN